MAKVSILVVAIGLSSRWVRADDFSAPTPVDQAVAGMTVPSGFKVTLFAGEPDVRKPIALTFDSKGRMWVVECGSRSGIEGKPGKDRVVLIEDADGDGKFDRRAVFFDQGTNLSGIELGFGGVWLCSAPNLLYIPDRDRDDRPDGPAVVVLDGWDAKSPTNVLNGLIWGPDGWLWGCNSALSDSRVGTPGVADDKRTLINSGVWRYHPTRKVFEVVAHGTANPWGLDFDEFGEAFVTNSVISHIFHITPGGHYARSHGQDVNPHAYQLMGPSGDHLHWDTAGRRPGDRSRDDSPATDKAGGGHAHSGAAVCLADNWPEQYRNTILMGNIHGNRLNHDRLERSGSTYIARHLPDFLRSNDRWFHPIAQKFGPDGSLYILDWSEPGESRENNKGDGPRETGRIFRVSYGNPRPFQQDLSLLDDLGLLDLQRKANEWAARQARRILQERAAPGKEWEKVHAQLRGILGDANLNHPNDHALQLRAIWTFHGTGGLTEQALRDMLDVISPYQRLWGLRLLFDDRAQSLAQETIKDVEFGTGLHLESRWVAASLRRIPPQNQQVIINELLKARRKFDFRANLDDLLLTWYTIEPTVSANPGSRDWAEFAISGDDSLLCRLVARRMVESSPEKGLNALVAAMIARPSLGSSREALRGVEFALRGIRVTPKPGDWQALTEKFAKIPTNREEYDPILRLSLLVGDPTAVNRMRSLVRNGEADSSRRRLTLRALAEARTKAVDEDLIRMIGDFAINRSAVKALAFYDDPNIAHNILNACKNLTLVRGNEREDALATLASRPAWTALLLDALARGDIQRQSISIATAWQIRASQNPEILAAFEKAWGPTRPTGKDKIDYLPRMQEQSRPFGWTGKIELGREVFQASCLPCHRVQGPRGEIGPELTAKTQKRFPELLQHVLDPGSLADQTPRLATIVTTDGRLLAGRVVESTNAILVLRTAVDRVVIPRDEIKSETALDLSTVPAGLFPELGDDDLLNLFRYLDSWRKE